MMHRNVSLAKIEPATKMMPTLLRRLSGRKRVSEAERAHSRLAAPTAILNRPSSILAGCYFIGVLFVFKSSGQKRAIADPAIYLAQTSPKIEAILGLPIQPGWPVRGSVISKHGFGNADLGIPLNGSRSKGILSEWAQQEKGKWHICSLRFTAQDQTLVTLVDEATTHCEPE